ncbi:MAG: DUF2254 domain-containing protein [Myxococcales bacterium]|nr:DUF2254 domain-containing protein [Myxococcales bacterium]
MSGGLHDGWIELTRLVRRPVVVLLTLPTAIVAGLGCVPIGLELAVPWIGSGPTLDPGAARALLGGVAGAGMSALALSYSLMLLVFTLAAGNVGPRLLERFTTDPLGQVTAGVLGGTFVYGLVGLVGGAGAPSGWVVVGGVVLGALVVLQLIVFVRKVATSVSIDREIVRIREGLVSAVDGLVETERHDGPDLQVVDRVVADTSGYVGAVDTGTLVAWACAHDATLRWIHRPGLYVLRGEVLLESDVPVDDADRSGLAAAVHRTPSREDDSIGFGLALLVEIALRALSPGVNDTYTAIAAVDALSDVIARLDGGVMGGSAIRGPDGRVRLLCPGLDLAATIGEVLHPLRSATTGNPLMQLALARTLARLHRVGSTELRGVLVEHRELLLDQVGAGTGPRADRDRVRGLLVCLDADPFADNANVVKKNA